MPATPLRIFVAALDWGLGHATRCVPLIERLQAQGVEVHLGSSGSAARFWRGRFPALPLHELPAYDVRYSAGSKQWLAVLRQVPRLRRVIAAEHERTDWLRRVHGFDAIISDHRYGCWSAHCPSVWLAHQLALRLPDPWKPAEPALARLHRHHLRPFSHGWVPDFPAPQGLAGRLVSDYPGQADLQFLGPLSRFSPMTDGQPAGLPASESAPYVALLSGPEPQRSQLEAQLQAAAPNLAAELWIVQGLPGPLRTAQGPNFQRWSFLDGPALAEMLTQARAVVARSGYSSLMDFAALRLPRLLLIPTPGQTEQQYLAHRWVEAGWAQQADQASLNIPAALQDLAQLPPARWPQSSRSATDQMDEVLLPWLTALQARRDLPT